MTEDPSKTQINCWKSGWIKSVDTFVDNLH